MANSTAFNFVLFLVQHRVDTRQKWNIWVSHQNCVIPFFHNRQRFSFSFSLSPCTPVHIFLEGNSAFCSQLTMSMWTTGWYFAMNSEDKMLQSELQRQIKTIRTYKNSQPIYNEADSQRGLYLIWVRQQVCSTKQISTLIWVPCTLPYVAGGYINYF